VRIGAKIKRIEDRNMSSISAFSLKDVGVLANTTTASALRGENPLGLRIVGGPGTGKLGETLRQVHAAFERMGVPVAKDAPMADDGQALQFEFHQESAREALLSGHVAGEDARTKQVLGKIDAAVSASPKGVAIVLDGLEHAPQSFHEGLSERMAKHASAGSRVAVIAVSTVFGETVLPLPPSLEYRFATVFVDPTLDPDVKARLASRREAGATKGEPTPQADASRAPRA
jgi:hypothetical protein